MVIHKIDTKFREFRLEAIAILVVELRRQRQEDQEIGHAAFFRPAGAGGSGQGLYRLRCDAAKRHRRPGSAAPGNGVCASLTMASKPPKRNGLRSRSLKPLLAIL